MKRLLWLLPIVVLAIAIIRSDTSQIVVYNDSGSPFGPLTIAACGQAESFPALDPKTSVRMRLRSRGEESAVALSIAGDAPWNWEGGYLEARGGYRAIVHVRSPEDIEVHVQTSFWR